MEPIVSTKATLPDEVLRDSEAGYRWLFESTSIDGLMILDARTGQVIEKGTKYDVEDNGIGIKPEHCGQIWVEGAPGSGFKFYLSLPSERKDSGPDKEYEQSC